MVAGSAQRYSALGGVANARVDLFGAELAAFMKRAAHGYTRLTAFGEEMPAIDNRVELASDKDEFGMPLGKITHGFNEDAVALFNANFDKGLEIAKATGAKDVWSNKGPMPTIHLMGGTIMGHSANQLGDQQLRPDPRDRQSLDRRAGHLSDQRRAEPDLLHPRAVAARRGEPDEELGDGRGLTCLRHCERSEAIQTSDIVDCFVAFAPRNDETSKQRRLLTPPRPWSGRAGG